METYNEFLDRLIKRGNTKEQSEIFIKRWGIDLGSKIINMIDVLKNEENKPQIEYMQDVVDQYKYICDESKKRIEYLKDTDEFTPEERDEILKEVTETYESNLIHYGKYSAQLENMKKTTTSTFTIRIADKDEEESIAKAKQEKEAKVNINTEPEDGNMPLYKEEEGYEEFIKVLLKRGNTMEKSEAHIKRWGIEGGKKIIDYIALGDDDVDDSCRTSHMQRQYEAILEALPYIKERVAYWETTADYPEDERKEVYAEVNDMYKFMLEHRETVKSLVDRWKGVDKPGCTEKRYEEICERYRKRGDSRKEAELYIILWGQDICTQVLDFYDHCSDYPDKEDVAYGEIMVSRYDELRADMLERIEYWKTTDEYPKEQQNGFIESAVSAYVAIGRNCDDNINLMRGLVSKIKGAEMLENLGKTTVKAKDSHKNKYKDEQVDERKFKVSNKNKISIAVIIGLILLRLLMLM